MNIAVFCGSSTPRNREFAVAARQLGQILAKRGHTIVYGGSNLGLMGEMSGAAMEEGGRVVAVIPTLFSEEIIRSQEVSEVVRVKTMAERKERIIAMCEAFVALPGGIGTIDEVSEVMVANQLGLTANPGKIDRSLPHKPMIMLNIDGFYNPFLEQMRQVTEEGLMRSAAGLVEAKSVTEAMEIIGSI